MSLKEFDMKTNLQNNKHLLIYGDRGSGVSKVIKNLITNCADIPLVVIVSPANGEYLKSLINTNCSEIPNADDIITEQKICILHENNEKIYDNILKRQKSLIAKNRKNRAENKELIDTRLLLIIDSFPDMKLIIEKWNSLKQIVFNGRHFHITCVMKVFSTNCISPILRSNFDIVILSKTDDENKIREYYTYYSSTVSDFSTFKQLYDEATNNCNFMIILNRHGSNITYTDKLFTYKLC